MVLLSFIFKFYGPALLSSTEDVGAKARVFAFPVGLPLFMLFLPRAQGEELSAGRYVHLVMARLPFSVRSGSSPAVQGFPGKGSSAGSELGLLLASRFFFSFSFSYVLLF